MVDAIQKSVFDNPNHYMIYKIYSVKSKMFLYDLEKKWWIDIFWFVKPTQFILPIETHQASKNLLTLN